VSRIRIKNILINFSLQIYFINFLNYLENDRIQLNIKINYFFIDIYNISHSIKRKALTDS